MAENENRRKFLIQVGALSACAGCQAEESALYPFRPREETRRMDAPVPSVDGGDTPDLPADMGNPIAEACMAPAPLDAETLVVGQVMTIPETATFIARDQRGYYAIGAFCPHQGCVVRYNSQAATFDCPCHGSRFTLEGKVRNGPAGTNLPHRPLCRLPNGRLAIDYTRFLLGTDQRIS